MKLKRILSCITLTLLYTTSVFASTSEANVQGPAVTFLPPTNNYSGMIKAVIPKSENIIGIALAHPKNNVMIPIYENYKNLTNKEFQNKQTYAPNSNTMLTYGNDLVTRNIMREWVTGYPCEIYPDSDASFSPNKTPKPTPQGTIPYVNKDEYKHLLEVWQPIMKNIYNIALFQKAEDTNHKGRKDGSNYVHYDVGVGVFDKYSQHQLKASSDGKPLRVIHPSAFAQEVGNNIEVTIMRNSPTNQRSGLVLLVVDNKYNCTLVKVHFDIITDSSGTYNPESPEAIYGPIYSPLSFNPSDEFTKDKSTGKYIRSAWQLVEPQNKAHIPIGSEVWGDYSQVNKEPVTIRGNTLLNESVTYKKEQKSPSAILYRRAPNVRAELSDSNIWTTSKTVTPVVWSPSNNIREVSLYTDSPNANTRLDTRTQGEKTNSNDKDLNKDYKFNNSFLSLPFKIYNSGIYSLEVTDMSEVPDTVLKSYNINNSNTTTELSKNYTKVFANPDKSYPDEFLDKELTDKTQGIYVSSTGQRYHSKDIKATFPNKKVPVNTIDLTRNVRAQLSVSSGSNTVTSGQWITKQMANNLKFTLSNPVHLLSNGQTNNANSGIQLYQVEMQNPRTGTSSYETVYKTLPQDNVNYVSPNQKSVTTSNKDFSGTQVVNVSDKNRAEFSHNVSANIKITPVTNTVSNGVKDASENHVITNIQGKNYVSGQPIHFNLRVDDINPEVTNVQIKPDGANAKVILNLKDGGTENINRSNLKRWRVASVKPFSPTSNKYDTSWVQPATPKTTDTFEFLMKDSADVVVEVQDVAGNITSKTIRVDVPDTTPPNIKVSDNLGGYSQNIDGVETFKKGSDWSKEPIKLTLEGWDRSKPTGPSGIGNILASTEEQVFTPQQYIGVQKVTKTITSTRPGIHTFRVTDKAGNVSQIEYFAPGTDNERPLIEWNSEYDELNKRTVLYITAKDSLSGVQYIEYTDPLTQQKVKIEGQTPVKNENGLQQNIPVSTKVEIHENMTFDIKAVDRVGNETVQTLDMKGIVTDFYVESFKLNQPWNRGSIVSPSVVFGQTVGTNEPIDVQIYYEEIENGKTSKKVLASDTLTIPVGNTKEWTPKFKVPSSNIKTIYAVIGESKLEKDKSPENNTKSLNIETSMLDYKITSTFNQTSAKPASLLEVPFEVIGTKLGLSMEVPVTLSITNQSGTPIVESVKNIVIGSNNNPVADKFVVTLPQDDTIFNQSYTVELKVNWEDRANETNQDNNIWTLSNFYVKNDNLSLVIENSIPENITVEDGNTYMYPSKSATYNLKLKAADSMEKIVYVKTDGKVFKPNSNSTTVELNLDKQQSQDFRVIVQSYNGLKERTYNFKVARMNDNTEIEVIVVTENGNEYKGIVTEDGKIKVPLPNTDISNAKIIITTVDENGKIISVDKQEVNSNKYESDLNMKKNSSQTTTATTSAQDATYSTSYEITITTTNTAPSMSITNKKDVQGKTFSQKGVMSSDSDFKEYSPDITSLEIAKRSERYNGIALEIKVHDEDPEQYLRGYIEIPTYTANGTPKQPVKYPIRWGSFDGKQVISTDDPRMNNGDILGYIYVDKSALRSDVPVQEIKVVVTDSKTDSEHSEPLTQQQDTVIFGVDITSPKIEAIGQNGNEEQPGSVLYSISDSYNGVENVSMRVSKDNGRSWDEPIQIESGANKLVTLVDKKGKPYTGTLTVELQATDKVKNTGTYLVNLDVSGGSVDIDSNIYTTISRVAKVAFVNTRKNNSGSIDKETLDTFK